MAMQYFAIFSGTVPKRPGSRRPIPLASVSITWKCSSNSHKRVKRPVGRSQKTKPTRSNRQRRSVLGHSAVPAALAGKTTNQRRTNAVGTRSEVLYAHEARWKGRLSGKVRGTSTRNEDVWNYSSLLL
ncbi:MAG TPA: hypothetical protein VEL31_31130 [Ktedonobacteraceae bacterium]|nr:hypothetical protein [Ktedonobacteraceae bacterium]